MRDTVKHRAAVVAEGWRQVSENLPFVWGAHRVRVSSFICSRTGKGHVFVTSLVNDETTDLALISLLSKSPYEVLAMAAECRLFEKAWHKAMIFNHIHIFLLESSFPTPEFLGKSSVCITRAKRILARVIRFYFLRHNESLSQKRQRRYAFKPTRESF